MLELPLFPLNTVLFPGMPLSLHIFEERYRQMIRLCLDTQQPFGVVLIRQGVEALGPLAEPHNIGCTAQITRMEPLDDGCMNILTAGRERFRIFSLSYELPYLVGRVEMAPFENQDPQALATARRLRPWVDRYLKTLARVGSVEFDPPDLPGDPLALAYLAAYVLQVPPAEKQTFLDVDKAGQLLADLLAVYRREVTLLSATRSQVTTQVATPLSQN